jgi:hypothetical protein
MSSKVAYCIECYSQLSPADTSPETRAFLHASQRWEGDTYKFNEPIIATGRLCFKCKSFGLVIYYDNSEPPPSQTQSGSWDATL